ncbi:MAG: DUF4105 domain-containing protein, partial [Gammaproteobacteria bacterium]|nr:DUF4105 domain-containing protein [Gammaproteobacteria bacterium]
MRFFVFLLIAVLTFCDVHAADRLEPILQRARELNLAEDRTWLRLLHFENGDASEQSEILDDDFLLADNGRFSPYDELVATLEAILDDSSSDPDQRAGCRFPARRLFLNTKLELGLEDAECPRLERWIKAEQLDSVSLMMISGYFGNPASTFGHVLLKVNNGAIPDGYTLLDLGINFGAVVPENEQTIVYVMRGLFGAYQAGFSDQDYYRADLTYTRTEFRDMWEYKLNLSDYQLKLLLYHVWEITGRRFRYFFLSTNCAFRIAELMELVTEEPFVQGVDAWYAPISLFHRLDQVDSNAHEGDGVISSIRYRPSAQQTFLAQVEALDGGNKALLNELIESGGNLDALRTVDAGRRSRVLDVLLEYYQYRMAGNLDEDTDASLRRAKDDAVRARLALPAADAVTKIEIPARRAPSTAAPPSKIGIGFGHNEELGSFSYASYAPFSYETTGNNLLDFSSLIMADLSLAFDDDGLRLERLDIVRARKVNLNNVRIAGESTSSWEVAFGARR